MATRFNVLITHNFKSRGNTIVPALSPFSVNSFTLNHDVIVDKKINIVIVFYLPVSLYCVS